MKIHNFSALTIILPICAGIAAGFAAEIPSLRGEPNELATPDLAFALGVRWWSYTLHFDKSVSAVTVSLCELRRQPDGTWLRSQLAAGHGFKHEQADTQEVRLSVLISGQPTPKDLTLRLDDAFGSSKLTAAPDFTRTYSLSSSARFINGCLVLAVEEKDPHRITGQEKNMVRFIGLSIETE
jgi:hypothetical protein